MMLLYHEKDAMMLSFHHVQVVPHQIMYYIVTNVFAFYLHSVAILADLFILSWT
jgi:hypothetical protein